MCVSFCVFCVGESQRKNGLLEEWLAGTEEEVRMAVLCARLPPALAMHT